MVVIIEVLFFVTSAFILGYAQNSTDIPSISSTPSVDGTPFISATPSISVTPTISVTPFISATPSAIDSSSSFLATSTNSVQINTAVTTVTAGAATSSDASDVTINPSATGAVATTSGTSATTAPVQSNTANTTAAANPTTTGNLADTSTPSVTPTTTATNNAMTSLPSVSSEFGSTVGSTSATPSLQSSYTSTTTTGAALSPTATTPLVSPTPAPSVTTGASSPSPIQPSSTSSVPSTSGVVDNTTTTATTTSPTTTTAASYLDFKTDTAVYILTLNLYTVSSQSAHIYYNKTNETQAELENKIHQALNNTNLTYSLKKKNDSVYHIEVKFVYSPQSSSVFESLVQSAFTNLNTSGFTISPLAINATSEFFKGTFTDACKAENICPLSFVCVNGQGCKHACAGETCNGNGQCIVDIKSNGANDPTVEKKCTCDESYDTEYYGDKCENSRTGKLQIIAIIAGVLGAAILVLFIALIAVCLTRHKKESGYNFSSKKYDNSAFDPVEK